MCIALSSRSGGRSVAGTAGQAFIQSLLSLTPYSPSSEMLSGSHFNESSTGSCSSGDFLSEP